MIQDLWARGTECILDMQVVNTEVASPQQKIPDKSLLMLERDKKYKYLESFLYQQRNFSPFVVSVGGKPDTETKATLKILTIGLTKKWRQPYSWKCKYVRSRFTITMVVATRHCVRLSWVTASWISIQQPQREDGAGIHLFQ